MPLKDEWGGVEVAELEDEFGGVAIDEQDEFGGVPVEEIPKTGFSGIDENPTQSLPPIKLSPYEEARVAGLDTSGMSDSSDLIRAVVNDPKGIPGAIAQGVMAPFSFAGQVINAGLQDAMTTVAGDPESGGNLYELLGNNAPGGPLPFQRTLAELSSTDPIKATTGKIASGLVESLPLLAVMPQGALGKLVAAGFTADMINHASEEATALGEEMGKPPEERDADRITSAISGIAQAAAFAPLTGAHAGGKVIGERVAPRAEAIRELANQLKREPLDRPATTPEAQRQLGIRLDQGENVLGTPELAGLADRALQQGPNPPLARGELSALEQIRRELNPPEIQAVEPTRVAERIEGGGEAPYGRVSYQRGAEAPLPERTQRAIQEREAAQIPLDVQPRNRAEVERQVREQAPVEAQGEALRVGEAKKITGDSVLEMPAEAYFDTAQKWARDAMEGKGEPVQIQAELAALRDPNIQKWKDGYQRASQEAAAVRAEVQANPASMGDPAVQKRFGGAAQKAQFFSEGLKVLEGTEPNARTKSAMEREQALSTGERKFSNALEDEIAYKLDSKMESFSPGDPKPTRAEVLKELMQDSDLPDSMASTFKKELQDFGIESGIYKSFTKSELDNIQATRGKKYDFKRGDKYYRFEGWKPLERESLRANRVKTTEIAEPIPLKDTAAEVTKFEAEFPGAPKINIAPDFSAMPKTAQDLAMSVGSDPRLIEAYVRGGEVWLNAGAITSPAMVKRLALHETGGHWAVDAKLGKGLQRFMEQTHDSWANSETMAAVRERYPNADKITLGRELIARLAEDPMLAPNVWNKIVAQFRQWLRDAGFVKKVTENDIQALITGAVDGMRKVERGEATAEGMLSLKSAAEKANERFPEKLDTSKDPVEGEAQNRRRGVGEILPDKPGVAAQSNIEGGPERMRQSAARATTSESVPPAVQERIAEAPESFYKSQKYKSVEEAVAAAGDAELAAVPKDSNFHVASQLELSRRLFAQGKLEEGYNVFKAVSKQGTEWGQNINQFKMLKGTTPANIIDLVNQGLKEAGRDPLSKKQMEDLAKVADESIQANKSLETAKQDWQKNPTNANAKKAQDLLDAANKSDLKTQREMNRFKIKTWPQMLKTFAQGNPLTPISHVANFVGNTLGAAMEGSSRSVAALIDTTRAAMTSGERKVSVGPRGFTEASKGFGRGLKQAPGILAKGSGDTVKGEYRAGLQPLRALAKAFAKNPDVPTVGGKVPINERIRLAVEGTFGIAPETMLRLLGAADKPAYEAARARLINEQAKLKKVPAKDLNMAQRFPELFFDKETLSQIKLESADAIFQRPSKAVNMLQNLIREKGGDWADLAFTILVSPYKLTPWNLVVRTLQYNPLIAAAKTAIEAGKGNTRAAEISAGRMVVGSILYGAGYYLYQNGLIGPSLEGRSESQKSRLLSGEVLPPNHVNVSGLKRATEGGDPAFQPGDETIDLTRGGGAAGAILSSVANIGRRMEKKPEAGGGELAASLVRDGVLEQANFTINQSFLKGVTGVLDAIQNGNLGPYVNGVESMVLNVGTPNTLTALSRATRENAPDMKTDTVMQELGNVVKNRFGILGADDYLPTKRDLFGEPMPQTPEGRNAILYHLFDISKGRQVTDDPVKLELYRLWRRTASSEAIPSIPERQITVDKKTYPLPTPLYSRFAELVGKERKAILDEIVKNPEFNGLPDEVKISILEKVYRAGAETGKQKFLSESFDELKPLPERSGFKK